MKNVFLSLILSAVLALIGYQGYVVATNDSNNLLETTSCVQVGNTCETAVRRLTKGGFVKYQNRKAEAKDEFLGFSDGKRDVYFIDAPVWFTNFRVWHKDADATKATVYKQALCGKPSKVAVKGFEFDGKGIQQVCFVGSNNQDVEAIAFFNDNHVASLHKSDFAEAFSKEDFVERATATRACMPDVTEPCTAYGDSGFMIEQGD